MSLPSYVRSDFAIYDDRWYVRGASILAAMDKTLYDAGGVDAKVPFYVKRAKFMRKTGCNGLLRTSFGRSGPAGIEDAAAHVAGRLGERVAEAWFVPDEDRPVERKRPSGGNISDIVPAGDYAGSCHVSADGLESALCILVNANKLVQLSGQGVQRSFGDVPPVPELVYLEDLTIDVELARLDTQVTVETIGVREGGGRVYSLNRLRFTVGDGDIRSCRMGFSFEAKSGGRGA